MKKVRATRRERRLQVNKVELYKPFVFYAAVANVGRHLRSKLWASDMPRYKGVILASAPEILSVRNPIKNKARTYIAGQDAIESWDARMMRELGLPLQSLSPDTAQTPVVNIARRVA